MSNTTIATVEYDIEVAKERIGDKEARYLIDLYYSVQKDRVRIEQRIQKMQESGEPCAFMKELLYLLRNVEGTVKKHLERYVKEHRSETARWLMSVKGVGPVLAAGFLSILDVTDRPTAGAFWRFAGLDPSVEWKPGQKRPWNNRLKTLCWKAADSFKKLSNDPDCFYGQIYRARKELETKKNEAGEYRHIAEETLRKFPNHAQKEWYKKGMLPPGRIDLRAMRYAAKIFLSHLHYVMYLEKYGQEPPKPYAIAVLGHADMIYPPGLNGSGAPKKREKRRG